MHDPVIVIVEDDYRSRRALERVLGRRFGGDYRVLAVVSAESALDLLRELASEGREVALILADQWLPDWNGVDVLAFSRNIHPRAKRVLLIDYGDQSCKEPILQAMALGQIDHFVRKSAEFPDQWLYPAVGEFLSEWSRANRPGFEAVTLVDERWSPRGHDLRDKLGANGIPYGFYEADSATGQQLLRRAGADASRLPVVILHDGTILLDPSDVDIAHRLGAHTSPAREDYDLVIVGGGPAGLAAAVYAASEGLRTAVLERKAIGGQAGASSLIRNYLGFPRGIAGADLAARAYEQAWLFGVDFVFLREADRLCVDGDRRVVQLASAETLRARVVLIATGASYRRLEARNVEALAGAGVFYGAAAPEARAMDGLEVYIAGGGNAAGQAALHLARHAARVEVLCRGESLSSTMSDYLVQEILAARNVVVRPCTEVVEAHGARRLEGLTLRDTRSGEEETVPAAALFVLIGAEPHTEWLAGTLQRDADGYILTGRDVRRDGRPPWALERAPHTRESSLPGVFAAGDVRHGSVKRVASSVGEGAVAVQQIHEYLAG